MRLIVRIFCLGMFALLGSTAIAADKSVATVNGKKISKKTFDQFVKVVKTKNPQLNVDENRKAIIQELANREALYQAAKKQKIHKDPQISFLLKQQEMDLVIKAMISKRVGDKKVKEKQLKKLYDDKIAGANRKEFKARHILLKGEDDAKAVIAELDSGKDFQELAKKKSTGPSASSGGDLGWFPPARMVPPFARAVSEMKKGTYSKAPVKTRFGFHVILLEDSRTTEAPKYEDVKVKLEQALKQQMAQEYMQGIISKAKIKIK